MTVHATNTPWSLFSSAAEMPTGLAPLSHPGFCYWLAQFLLLPLFWCRRAAFPPLALLLGAGLLPGDLPRYTLFIASLVGIALLRIAQIQRAADQSSVGNGLTVGLLSQTVSSGEGNEPEESRSIMETALLAPCLALSYLIFCFWHQTQTGLHPDETLLDWARRD